MAPAGPGRTALKGAATKTQHNEPEINGFFSRLALPCRNFFTCSKRFIQSKKGYHSAAGYFAPKDHDIKDSHHNRPPAAGRATHRPDRGQRRGLTGQRWRQPDGPARKVSGGDGRTKQDPAARQGR